MVTRKDIMESLRSLGVSEGDTIITHSSFKRLGETENGADTVIKGMSDAVGETGSVVFPTLCQKDWDNIFKNWHLDADSDVGYLTNYFRKLPGVRRSDQATHSVAAMGAKAEYITETHGVTGQRYGIFGDAAFAADSPWEKLYKLNAKMICFGVEIKYLTMRHYVEYIFMEDMLKRAGKSPDFEEYKRQIWCYERFKERGVWPALDNFYIQKLLDKEGKVRYGKCGNAELILVNTQDFVKCGLDILYSVNTDGFRDQEGKNSEWIKTVLSL